MLENTSDLDSFFDTDTHATAATLGAATVNGIFNNDFMNIPVDVGVDGSQPVFVCKSSDVSGASRGDTITIAGNAYTIRGLHADGTGVTTLILEEQ